MTEANAPEPLLDQAIEATAKQQPNLLFTTNIWYEDRAKETIEHISAPKFVDDFIQLARTEDLVMINKKLIRKAITSVKVLPESNGCSRILQ